MSEKIVQLNEEVIKGQIKELVRGSVEEALIEMYLAGVSVRRVEDITEALWGSKVSPATISELNKKAYIHIEDWRNRPLQGGRYLIKTACPGIEPMFFHCRAGSPLRSKQEITTEKRRDCCIAVSPLSTWMAIQKL